MASSTARSLELSSMATAICSESFLKSTCDVSGSADLSNDTMPLLSSMEAEIWPWPIIASSCPLASSAPCNPTSWAMSSRERVTKVCVRRWMFRLYTDASAWFARPRFWSRTRTVRYLSMLFCTSSGLCVASAVASSLYSVQHVLISRWTSVPVYFGSACTSPWRIIETSMYFLYASTTISVRAWHGMVNASISRSNALENCLVAAMTIPP
mmetsp:Transcript_34882/g.82696  ORF Transcript_34882/g.82696 Transcript_34882/m.82696 type:complete len:211 (-) Transcript_34882:560-1192(-)